MLEVELAEKEAGKKAAVKKRDYDTAGKLSKQVKALKAELEKIASGGAKAGAGAAELEPAGPMVNPRYPNIPMTSYINDKVGSKPSSGPSSRARTPHLMLALMLALVLALMLALMHSRLPPHLLAPALLQDQHELSGGADGAREALRLHRQ